MRIKTVAIGSRACMAFGGEAARAEAALSCALDILSHKAPTPLSVALKSLETAKASIEKAGGHLPETGKKAGKIACAIQAIMTDLKTGSTSSSAGKARTNWLKSLKAETGKLYLQGEQACR